MNPINILYNNQNSSLTTMVVVSLDDLKQAFQAWTQELIEANAPKDETFITVKEAAAILKVDPSTLWRWDKDKYLEKIRIGTKVRYRLSDVERIKKGGVV